ncbi:MAG: NAD(P)-dependent oxidoreductase [Desulfamplus sp.]|nr:NAD(P)-dependent oxidoreductase [Desulfamplus sp.]
MNILVTGATGFIGQHVVELLIKRGHAVIATSRSIGKAHSMPWFDYVKFIPCDLHDPELKISTIFGTPDVVIHLAWSDLPNYKSLSHFEVNLPAAYRFLKNIIIAGTKQLLVSGTCFEYGTQNGSLAEKMPTLPANPYGVAKDTLRKFLESLKTEHPFTLQWVRLFYMYGSGQHRKSLMAQLDRAIDNGDTTFKMSGGEQLRDYLPIKDVAKRICFLVENPSVNGIINCCSGKPVSVRSLVEQHIQKRGAEIKLSLGYYPYPDYEPMAFWGECNQFLKNI